MRFTVIFIRLTGILCLLSCLPQQVMAQLPQRTASFVVSPEENEIRLDLLTVASTIKVTHTDSIITDDYLLFDPASGLLTFIWPRTWSSLPVELSVSWSYIPLSLQRRYSLREIHTPTDAENDTLSIAPIVRYTRQSQDEDFGLQSRGSITRGVIVGSNRDFGLESGLRFDLQGYITEDVYITASLSDQNSLIQPDGTTQSLREFDQVFIRISAPGKSLQLGDIDVSIRRSQIARLSRRLQGAGAEITSANYGDTRMAAAVLRGTFRVNEFRGREGVQGPYRLTGENNEAFIIVVAGTEQVFLDGRQLVRGEDNDYIIDYGLGEIYFTNRRLIRSSHRIRVEFQYLSNSYNRTLVALETDNESLLGGRLKLGATFIREADNINITDGFGLSPEDIEILREAGSDRSLMRADGADSVGFRTDAPFILYSRIDTVYQGQVYSIFKNIPGDPSGVFRVQFSRVDPGMGAYRRRGSSVNGILYEWVGPGLGDYEPFRQLSGPTSNQIIALRSHLDLSRHIYFSNEWAASSYSINRYARDLSSQNDFMNTSRIGLRDIDVFVGNLDVSVGYEYKGQNFRFFDRVRDVEFNRRWDIVQDSGVEDKQFDLRSNLRLTETSGLEYAVQQLDRTGQKGLRQDFSAAVQEENIPFLQIQAGSLNSENRFTGTETSWQNADLSTGYAFSLGNMGITPNIGVSYESRGERQTTENELLPGSFRYVEYIPGLMFQFSEHVSMSTSYSVRSEYEMLDGELQKSADLYSPEVDLRFSLGSNLTSNTRLAYRENIASEAFRENLGRGDVKGVAIRSANDIRLWNRAVESSILYDAATESRSVLQESYLEVGPEFGQYVWVDLNNDGVQQVDEFFPQQNPNEGTFIRQLLPSDELIPVISMNGRWRLKLNFFSIFQDWREGAAFVRFLANTVYISTVEVREQNQTSQIRDIYLLKPGAFLDENNTLNGRFSWNQELQLMRRIPEWDVRLFRNSTESLGRLSAGLEKSGSEESRIMAEYRSDNRWSLSQSLRYIERRNESTELSSRNYFINGWEAEPSFRYYFDRTTQVGFTTIYAMKEDKAGGEPVSLRSIRLAAEALLTPVETLQLGLNAEFRNMDLRGNSSPLGVFELTNGAGVGITWQWGMRGTWNVSETVRATLQYNGRTVTDGNPIQTMRITVSAVF